MANNHTNARLRLLHHLNQQEVWRQTALTAKVLEEIPNGRKVGIALSRLRHCGVVEEVHVQGESFVHLRLSSAVRELTALGLLDLTRLT